MITVGEKLDEKYANIIKKHLPTGEREKIIVTEFGARVNTIRAVIMRERKVNETQLPLMTRLVYKALDCAKEQNRKTEEMISQIEEMIHIAA